MPSKHIDRLTRNRLSQRKYFADLENILVDRMFRESKLPEAHHRSTGAPCVSDCELLKELAELGFPASSLNALRLIPMVEVAWADNVVDARERRVILLTAVKLGINPHSEDYVLLDHWLHAKPPANSIEAWTRFMRCLMDHIGEPAKKKLIEYFSAQMLRVAKASGGYFGLGKVSAKEREVIDAVVGGLGTKEVDRLETKP